MSRLTVTEMCGTDALRILQAEWQAIFSAVNNNPFLSWEWMFAWQEAFGQQRRLHLLCARTASGQLVGILPLLEARLSVRSRTNSWQQLAFVGDGAGAADYLDILALPGWEHECAMAFIQHLATIGRFDLLELNDLAADSLTLPLLTMQFGDARDFRLRLLSRNTCPQVDLSIGWSQVLARSSRARYFQYCLRRMERAQGFEFRTVTAVQEIPAALERFLVLHQACWALRGGSMAAGAQPLREFHRQVVQMMAASGRVRFDELWVDGDCRASLYSLESRDTMHFYLSGYDPQWAKFSPGFVVLGLSIQHAAERGLRCYDFLRGAESYKFEWATHARATVTVQVIGRRWSAAAFQAREYLEAMARTVLPQSAISVLGRMRRLLRGNRDAQLIGTHTILKPEPMEK